MRQAKPSACSSQPTTAPPSTSQVEFTRKRIKRTGKGHPAEYRPRQGEGHGWRETMDFVVRLGT